MSDVRGVIRVGEKPHTTTGFKHSLSHGETLTAIDRTIDNFKLTDLAGHSCQDIASIIGYPIHHDDDFIAANLAGEIFLKSF